MRGLQLEVYYVVVDERFYVFSRVIDFILCSANIIMPHYGEYKVFEGVFYYAAVIVDIIFVFCYAVVQIFKKGLSFDCLFIVKSIIFNEKHFDEELYNLSVHF